jgi:hypothetical protein
VVATGVMEIGVEGAHHRPEAGNAVLFHADGPHDRHPGAAPAVTYLVMTYSEAIG